MSPSGWFEEGNLCFRCYVNAYLPWSKRIYARDAIGCYARMFAALREGR